MGDERLPLNDMRLAAVWETAKLGLEPRCVDEHRHRPGCRCVPHNPLSRAAMEMVEELRKVRELCREVVQSSGLFEGPSGPSVLIKYEHFRRLSEVVQAADADDGIDL